MDIRPRNASPILKRKTKQRIPNAILNPFFLKKLKIGPATVPLIHAITFVRKLKPPNFFCITLSVLLCSGAKVRQAGKHVAN